jgi:hypothetical protein
MLPLPLCVEARPLRPRRHRHHGRLAWTRLGQCASPNLTCCMQGCGGRSDMQQTCSPQNATAGPGPRAGPVRLLATPAMHTQRVMDAIWSIQVQLADLEYGSSQPEPERQGLWRGHDTPLAT